MSKTVPADYRALVMGKDARSDRATSRARPSGHELIRRSMTMPVRRRIGEAQWRQGEMMLGHVEATISDIHAIPDPASLGLALAATAAIIDEIEALVPAAYHHRTAELPHEKNEEAAKWL